MDDESRTEYTCPDPACDWKLVETRPAPARRAADIPWRGSIHDTVHALALERHQLLETAMEAHIRESHDPDNPHRWAVQTAEANRLRAHLEDGL